MNPTHGGILSIDRTLYHMKYWYLGSMFGLHFMYFAVFFGVLSVDQKYINVLNLLVQLFICVFLIIRFNPFRSNPMIKSMDKYVIFSSALILVTNLVAVEISNYMAMQKGLVPGTIKWMADKVVYLRRL